MVRPASWLRQSVSLYRISTRGLFPGLPVRPLGLALLTLVGVLPLPPTTTAILVMLANFNILIIVVSLPHSTTRLNRRTDRSGRRDTDERAEDGRRDAHRHCRDGRERPEINHQKRIRRQGRHVESGPIGADPHAPGSTRDRDRADQRLGGHVDQRAGWVHNDAIGRPPD